MEMQFEELGENSRKIMHQAGIFDIIEEASLHLFSDALEEDYGPSSKYGSLVNVSGKLHCCILMRKPKVMPKKYVTIPRL